MKGQGLEAGASEAALHRGVRRLSRSPPMPRRLHPATVPLRTGARHSNRIEYRKGPYFAKSGDFSAAGSADILYRTTIDEPFA